MEMRKKIEAQRRCTHPLVAIQARAVTRVLSRALERMTDASLNTRKRRPSEGKFRLTPTRTPAILSGYSRFHFFFALLWRLGVLAVRNFVLIFFAPFAPLRPTFSIAR